MEEKSFLLLGEAVNCRVIDAYGKVQPNLAKHEAGFPTADALTRLVVTGHDSYGMAAVGDGRMTPGAPPRRRVDAESRRRGSPSPTTRRASPR